MTTIVPDPAPAADGPTGPPENVDWPLVRRLCESAGALLARAAELAGDPRDYPGGSVGTHGPDDPEAFDPCAVALRVWLADHAMVEAQRLLARAEPVTP